MSVIKIKPFDNVKGQIGFGGIWCGSCIVGNGALVELTKRYESIIENYGLKEWASGDFDFKEFVKGLASIQAVSSCPGCLNGGGKPNCELRNCALSKEIADCSECKEVATCQNSEELQKMREGARKAGLFVKVENVHRQELLKKWTSELKGNFPSCILLCGTQ
jgi:hypothetical protein